MTSDLSAAAWRKDLLERRRRRSAPALNWLTSKRAG